MQQKKERLLRIPRQKMKDKNISSILIRTQCPNSTRQRECSDLPLPARPNCCLIELIEPGKLRIITASNVPILYTHDDHDQYQVTQYTSISLSTKNQVTHSIPNSKAFVEAIPRICPLKIWRSNSLLSAAL